MKQTTAIALMNFARRIRDMQCARVGHVLESKVQDVIMRNNTTFCGVAMYGLRRFDRCKRCGTECNEMLEGNGDVIHSLSLSAAEMDCFWDQGYIEK